MQCPPLAQAGLITVRANYLGNPELPARDGADLQRRHRRRRSGPLHLQRADPEHPDRDPRRRPLRDATTACASRSPASPRPRPLSDVDMTFWGFPASNEHNPTAFPPEASPPRPAVPVWRIPAATSPPPDGLRLPNLPFTGNPSVCGRPMPTNLDVETYQRPGCPRHADASYPLTTDCERQTFKPFAQARLTTTRGGLRFGHGTRIQHPRSPEQSRVAFAAARRETRAPRRG